MNPYVKQVKEVADGTEITIKIPHSSATSNNSHREVERYSHPSAHSKDCTSAQDLSEYIGIESENTFSPRPRIRTVNESGCVFYIIGFAGLIGSLSQLF